MTLSEAKSKSKSVINTLRSLGVSDTEIQARLVNSMGFTKEFATNQLRLLMAPPKQAVNRPGKKRAAAAPKPGSIQAAVLELGGTKLFDKTHMGYVRDLLIQEGYSVQQINSAFGAARTKAREAGL